jgi:hypothetical protein
MFVVTQVAVSIVLLVGAGLFVRSLGNLKRVNADPAPSGKESRLAFYRDDYVLVLDATGKPVGARSDFLRDADGGVAWLRNHGRLFRHVG